MGSAMGSAMLKSAGSSRPRSLSRTLGDGLRRSRTTKADAVEAENGIRGYAYGDAGRFVAYLDHRFGRDVILRLLESTSRGDVSVEQFSSKVEDVTGFAWGDIARGYDESEVCEQHAYWDASPACAAAEPLTLCEGAEDVRHIVAVDCAAADVLGERRDEFTEGEGREVWTYRTVTFERAGGYAISIGGEWGRRIRRLHRAETLPRRMRLVFFAAL